MADITMCNDRACPERGNCYRAQAPVNEYRQSYFMGSPRDGSTCTHYWPMQDRINRNPKEKTSTPKENQSPT